MQKIALPADTKIDATVGIGPIPKASASKCSLTVTIPAWSAQPPRPWWPKAHEVCPYSNATRGNIEVTLSVV